MPQPWKAPRRPEHKVTQDFNDGMLTVYRVTLFLCRGLFDGCFEFCFALFKLRIFLTQSIQSLLRIV